MTQKKRIGFIGLGMMGAPMVQCLLETNDVSRDELDKLKQLLADHEKSRGKSGRKA